MCLAQRKFNDFKWIKLSFYLETIQIIRALKLTKVNNFVSWLVSALGWTQLGAGNKTEWHSLDFFQHHFR